MSARVSAKPLIPTDALTTRFLRSIAKSSSGCWLWRGPLNKGYGQLVVWNHSVREVIAAHRYAYTLHVGPVAADLTLDHLCRTRNCVNPEHLEPVSLAENIRRAAATKTTCKRGHPLDGVTREYGAPRRYCLTCNRERQSRVRARARAAKGGAT